MRLIYENGDYFGADARLPRDMDLATHRDYNIFSPSGTLYHNIITPGSYSLGIRNISEYYVFGDKIRVMHQCHTRNVLMLGLVNDFMAFISHRIRDTTNSRIKLRAHRIVFSDRIRTLTANGAFEHLFILTRIFYAIIGSIRPPPYVQPLTESPEE